MLIQIAVISCVVIAVAFVSYIVGYDAGHNDGWFDCYSRLLRKARERGLGTDHIHSIARRARKRRAF